MKNVILRTLVIVFLVFLANGIQAQTLSIEEKLIEALLARDHKNAMMLVLEVESGNYGESNNKSMLMLASENGYTDVCKILIVKGAKLNLQNRDGITALMLASQKGHTEVVELLLDNGAKLDLKSNSGETAFMIASRYNQTEVSKFLLDYGAGTEEGNIQKPISSSSSSTTNTANAKNSYSDLNNGNISKTVQTNPVSKLQEGSTAYVRVKKYITKSIEDLAIQGIADSIFFGQSLTLVLKNDLTPTFWLVSTGNGQAWVPEYLITGNKVEIDYLKSVKRIPATMTFLYVDSTDVARYRGPGIVYFSNVKFLIDSENMSCIVGPEGTNPYGIKDNAVLIDESFVRQSLTWKENFLVFSKNKVPYKIKAGRLYYCISVSENEISNFDCIDLTTLRFCK